MDKKIVDLGTLSGKVVLFGGVYGNLQALEALITEADKRQIIPGQCLCTGDIVGYCAQPEETVSRFRQWGAKSIIGNVEEQLRGRALDCGCDFKIGTRCDGFAKMWYPYAQSKLSEASLEWMNTLPHHLTFRYADRTVTLVHGSYDHISEFIFQSTPWNTKLASFKGAECTIIVAGHSGLPFAQKKDHLLWLNPGVIGMPANEGLSRVWYVILDDNAGFSISYNTLEYNFEKAYLLMIRNGLPGAYAQTIVHGLWDNMEILPEEEKKLRGVNLESILK